MLPSRIVAVDHVHRQAPLGLEERIRWFYGSVGCLDEVRLTRTELPSPSKESESQPGPSPASLPCRESGCERGFSHQRDSAADDGLRMLFRSAQIELRIELSANPKVESAGFPVVLAIPSLDAAIKQLNEASWSFERWTGTTWADDCVATLDPAGNRVELRREWREI